MLTPFSTLVSKCPNVNTFQPLVSKCPTGFNTKKTLHLLTSFLFTLPTIPRIYRQPAYQRELYTEETRIMRP